MKLTDTPVGHGPEKLVKVALCGMTTTRQCINGRGRRALILGLGRLGFTHWCEYASDEPV